MLLHLLWLILDTAKRFRIYSLLFLIDSWKGRLECYRIDFASLRLIELCCEIINLLDNVLLILFFNFVELLVLTLPLLVQFGFRVSKQMITNAVLFKIRESGLMSAFVR